jgi:hypothetical protein
VSTIGHGVRDSRVDLVVAEDGHGCWPINVGRFGVPVTNTAIRGHSVGESINGARSHHFLLNNESAKLSPT